MKHSFRIALSILILIGSTLAFAYWALGQFNETLDIMNRPISCTSPEKSNAAPSPSTPPLPVEPFKFISPKSGATLYIGCKYTIDWSGTPPDGTDFSLVDNGTYKPEGPVTSGIPKNLTDGGFSWKVGSVWPGTYYILAAGNPPSWKQRSGSFTIANIPAGSSPEFCSKHSGMTATER